jgi:basic amino acid/polyamine antiporter, APA family
MPERRPNPLFATKPVADLQAEAETSAGLRRSLGPGALIALGIGAIIGAGIFTLTGIAAATHAGPAVVLSFLAAAVGCVFAGLCYSEFSAMIPVAGSAYTYSYATMGEFVAWIIGWDLVLEYAVGAATVAIGWSSTFVSLLHGLHIDLPPALLASPLQELKMPDGTMVHGIVNLPALFVVVLTSLILVRGIKESATVNSIIVVLKVAVILVFVAIGWKHMTPGNHTPFIPENTGEFGAFGWSGILRGAGLIFFAYVGFDAVSTAAQETKLPKRDMPIGIIGSLLVCTVLFVLYAYVLTGIVNYKELKVASPITLALDVINIPVLGLLMKLAVLAGLTSVVLVMLLGQSRVFFSMSRDGLLPGTFSACHPRFQTPWRSNLIMMVFVGGFAAFLPIKWVGEMTSIGTLFAFVLVCAGIMFLRWKQPGLARPFRTPFVPLVPILGIAANLAMMLGLGTENWIRLFVWMALGMVIYFGYSRHHSKLTAPPRQ